MKSFFTALIVISSATFAHAAEAEHFVCTRHFPLQGSQRWDYITADDNSGRLYIARTDRISIVDTKTGNLLAEIMGLQGAHGVALNHEQHQGYATDGKAGQLVIFDLNDFKKIKDVNVGKGPDSLVYDADAKKVFVFNGKSEDASVVDPQTQKVVATLPLHGRPEFAVSDDQGHVFVNLENKNSLVRIDSKNLKVEKTFALQPCEEPTGLALDSKDHRLFIGCGNKMMAVVNAETGKVLAHLPAGEHIDATAYDAAHGLAFASAGDGTLTVVQAKDPEHYEVLESVKTPRGSKTMALLPQSGTVYLVEAQFEESQGKPSRTIIANSCTVGVYEKQPAHSVK